MTFIALCCLLVSRQKSVYNPVIYYVEDIGTRKSHPNGDAFGKRIKCFIHRDVLYMYMYRFTFSGFKNTFDILLLQEKWIFSFQIPFLDKYFTGSSSSTAFLIEQCVLPPTQKPRGYGEVACLITKRIQTKYKFLPNGCNRVTSSEVQRHPPLCVVGVYMPVRGTSGKTDFIEIQFWMKYLRYL